MTDLVLLRDIAKHGVLTDADPYDLPAGAWSFGVNARFRNGKITRAPVFRSARVLSTANPRYVVGSNPTSGLDNLFVGYDNGKVFKVTPTTETDYSITSYTPSTSQAAWSHCHLADVFYVNREDRVPWALRTSDGNFQTLSNWDSTWRARLLRSVGSALVALNVTKGSTNYPTMVKTSSFATVGTVPTSWDQSTPATNATENILAELEGPIVDAQVLRNSLFIYGSNETWLMQLVGGTDVWDYSKVFDNRGAINVNCSIEIQGKHYVFGLDDIWMHDGVTPVSICDGAVRDFIFSSINISKSNRCFVAHNAALKEIHFCYISGDRGTAFMSADGCNRQAVFNYSNNTWTFDDLPFVYMAARANINTAVTYATVTASYATIGGTYLDQEDGYKKNLVYVGDANTGYSLSTSLYAFDLYGVGSSVSFPVDTNATKGMLLERDGIDLDVLGLDLRGYKTVNSLYPQARIDADAAPLVVTVGSSDYYGVAAAPIETQTYDGRELYKLDYNAAGRYLSMSLTFNDYKYISISGFDLDVSVTGER